MKLNELLKTNHIKPKTYLNRGKATIIDDGNNKYVVKKKIKNFDNNLYEYLTSRSFDYFPLPLVTNNDYEITKYIDDKHLPKEEKAKDIISLATLLHNKTTYYKVIDIDDNKIIYEDINNQIMYLLDYYHDLNDLIDTDIYMAPSEYLLVRNISLIYASLNYCKRELNAWYEIIKNSTKQRVCLVHNNLSTEHLLRDDNSYLISWDKAITTLPIYDLYNFYKNDHENLEFSELLKYYESKYSLKEEERKLLFILISMPEKIEFTNNEYENVKNVSSLINYLIKSEKIISPYYSKNQEQQQQ